MKTKTTLIFLLIFSISPVFSAQIKYAGVRQSCYGADNGGPFPTKVEWGNIMLNIADSFSGSIPTGLWIVGTIYNDTCILEFPSPGGTFKMIDFANKANIIIMVRDMCNQFISLQYNFSCVNDNAALSIVTTNGIVVKTYTINNDSGEVLWNKNNYASGIYLINVTNGNNLYTKKMILTN